MTETDVIMATMTGTQKTERDVTTATTGTVIVIAIATETAIVTVVTAIETVAIGTAAIATARSPDHAIDSATGQDPEIAASDNVQLNIDGVVPLFVCFSF